MVTARAAISSRHEVPLTTLAPGVTAAELLNDSHGCRGLHQRRLRLAGGASLAAAAGGGAGEAWYVLGGHGRLTAGAETVALSEGSAVWMRRALSYRCDALTDTTDRSANLEILTVTVQARSADPDPGPGPGLRAVTLQSCPAERTGDREFRVLLSSGLTITQFVGLIPPGRAPEHQHTYDEVVHILAGTGVVHLGGTHADIAPGTSVYLPPGQPHCLENTGASPLHVLGVFHPAGSPAAKQASR